MKNNRFIHALDLISVLLMPEKKYFFKGLLLIPVFFILLGIMGVYAQSCSDYSLRIDPPQPTGNGCYQVTLPVYLGGPEDGLMCGPVFEGQLGDIEGDVEIVGVDGATGFTVELVTNGGTTFELSSNSTQEFPTNSQVPFFKITLETSPGATFELLMTETIFSPGDCDDNNPPCTTMNINYVPSGAPDIDSDGLPEYKGVAVSTSCTSSSSGRNLELYVDTGNATYDELTYTTTIPVKLRDLDHSGSIPFTLFLNQMDFIINYEDVENNLEINLSDYNNSVVGSDTESPDLAGGVINGKISTSSPPPPITIVFSATGEATLFNIELTQPSTPLEGGDMDFEVEYARLEYLAGDCCTPLAGSPVNYKFENAPYKCPSNSASANPLQVSIEEPTEDQGWYRYPVNFEKSDGTGDEFSASKMLIDIEIVGEGVKLYEDLMQASLPSGLCNQTCGLPGFPQGGDCMELYLDNNQNWHVLVGFCANTNLQLSGQFFEIIVVCGCVDDVIIRRAQLEKNSGVDMGNFCVLEAAKNFTPQQNCANETGIVSFASFESIGVPGVNICELGNFSDCDCLIDNTCSSTPSISDIEGVFDTSPNDACRLPNKKLRACKSGVDLCGVSTFDLVQISMHILGVNTFTEPWKQLAADVNNSGSITTLDLIVLRKLILSIETELPAYSWRFYDCNYNFTFNTSGVIFDNLPDDCIEYGQRCFRGVKIGDVNGDADTTCGGEEPSDDVTVTFNTAVVGNYLEVLVEPTSFQQISAFQFELDYDPTKLSFGSILAEDLPFVDSDIMHEVAPGKIAFAWYDENGGSKSLQAGENIMKLRYQILGTGNPGVSINESRIPARAYKADGTVFSLSLPSGGGQGQQAYIPDSEAGASTVKIQVQPNPFKNDLSFQILSDERIEGELYIYDNAGRVIFKQRVEVFTGEKTITVEEVQKWAEGMYYYRFQTAQSSLDGKFIKSSE